jgi:cell division transport system permease protein
VHLFYLREAWRSMNKHRGLAVTSVLSLTAALTLSGLFLLLAHNAQFALELLGDRREMVVYLKDDVSPAVRDSLIGRLHALYGSVTYVNKGQAWEELKQQLGDSQLLEAVGQNPLPASMRVRLRPELLNYPAMREVARQVSEFPEVEEARFGDEWVRRLDELGSAFQRGAMAVGIVVALAIVFVVYNTIRLTVLARRSQVEIMSRLGASDGFIATPFVIEAVLQALFAALLALGILLILQQAVVARVVTMVFFSPEWIAAFVGTAMALSWLAASLALARVLRAVGP